MKKHLQLIKNPLEVSAAEKAANIPLRYTLLTRVLYKEFIYKELGSNPGNFKELLRIR